MDELVDGGLVACSCAGVCGSRPRSIHDHQRKGVQIRLLKKVLCSQRLLCGCGFLYGQKCSCANHRSRSRNVQKITAGHFHNMKPPVMLFALCVCALWGKPFGVLCSSYEKNAGKSIVSMRDTQNVSFNKKYLGLLLKAPLNCAFSRILLVGCTAVCYTKVIN